METSRRSQGLLILLVLAAYTLVAGVFFVRFSAVGTVLSRVVLPATSALLTALASIGCGALAFRAGRLFLVRAGADAGSEEAVEPIEDLLAGSAVFGSVVALVALAGWCSPSLTAVLALGFALVGVSVRGRAILATIRSVRIAPMLILVPPVIVAIAAALAPVNTPDEMVYKLAVPKSWELFGRMTELPLNSNSYFPNSIYAADLAAMLGGPTGAKLFHLLLYFATLGVIVRVSARVAKSGTLWPAAVVAWTPALAIIAGWAWAEWAMIGLALLSIYRFHAFLDEGRAHDLAVSAVSLGAALSAKYTALPWLAVFLLVAVHRLGRRQWRALAGAALVVAVTGGLFYARNAIWTGSPFAPFFLPDSPRIENYRSPMGGLVETLRGYDVFHPGIIDDSLGVLLPACVLLSPLALLAPGALVTDLFVMGAGQLLFLVPLAPTSRLMTLGLVPLALLGAVAVRSVWWTSTRRVRAGLQFLAALALFGQLLLTGYVFVTSWQFFRYLVGDETADAYLARTRDFHEAYQWIDRNTPRSAKLLLLGENRILYLQRRAIAQGNLDGPRVAAWLQRFGSPDAFTAELRREGFTHVLVHKPWYRVEGLGARPLRMLEKEFVLEVPRRTDAVVRTTLTTRARVVYSDRSYVLFELSR